MTRPCTSGVGGKEYHGKGTLQAATTQKATKEVSPPALLTKAGVGTLQAETTQQATTNFQERES